VTNFSASTRFRPQLETHSLVLFKSTKAVAINGISEEVTDGHAE
jgi:hypothetical protein